MVVTTTNLYSESRDIVKALINSNVTDPKTGTASSRRRWIYREFPDTTSNSFSGYPIIIIKSPDAEDDLQNLAGTLSDGTLSFDIQIVAEFNDKHARVDDISGQVFSLFKNRTHLQTLANGNLFRPRLISSMFSNTDQDGKKLSGRVFMVDLNTTLEDNS